MRVVALAHKNNLDSAIHLLGKLLNGYYRFWNNEEIKNAHEAADEAINKAWGRANGRAITNEEYAKIILPRIEEKIRVAQYEYDNAPFYQNDFHKENKQKEIDCLIKLWERYSGREYKKGGGGLKKYLLFGL
ncbi:MAG: hypothetical protein FWB86_06110 [Treponema sp.]|nr:hypothetical protein [Treponema sp.]MCL2250753.1 hypothetical protein [Treponema sp.]